MKVRQPPRLHIFEKRLSGLWSSTSAKASDDDDPKRSIRWSEPPKRLTHEQIHLAEFSPWSLCFDPAGPLSATSQELTLHRRTHVKRPPVAPLITSMLSPRSARPTPTLSLSLPMPIFSPVATFHDEPPPPPIHVESPFRFFAPTPFPPQAASLIASIDEMMDELSVDTNTVDSESELPPDAEMRPGSPDTIWSEESGSPSTEDDDERVDNVTDWNVIEKLLNSNRLELPDFAIRTDERHGFKRYATKYVKGLLVQRTTRAGIEDEDQYDW